MPVEDDAPKAVPPNTPKKRPTSSIVAAVTGLVGFALAVIVPLLPVTQTTTSIDWPQQGTLDPVTAPLMAYYPLEVAIEIPCSAVATLANVSANTGSAPGVLIATAPPQAGEKASARGLTVAQAGPNIDIRSRNVLVASAPLAEVTRPGGCDSIVINSTPQSTGAEFRGLELEGNGVGGRIDSDIRPQVTGIFSGLSGTPPAGLKAHVEVDSRYSTEATWLKKAAVALGVLMTLASLVALHRIDTRDRRTRRKILPARWWRPRPLDLGVVATLLLWHFIGANTSDDGYILTEARAAVASGYMPEVFRYYAAPYAPFGMPYYVYTAISEFTLSSVWLRLPALLLGIGSWILLSREVIPRFGPAARRTPAVRWTAAAVFLAFWLTYNNGLRPEPIIAFGVLATWVCLERALASGRLLPAAAGFMIGGFTLSAAPTGTFCIAVIIAASRPLILLVVRRAKRDGWLALLAPLLAAGTSVLFLIFWDQPLMTLLQSTKLLGEVGPAGAWYEETWRYEWLMNPTPDGSLARRFAVVAMLLSLLTCAAILLRKGRIPGVAGGPARRLVGLAFMSIAFMMFNPTKWTHHFGAFASIGAALAALVTMAVLPAATRSLRNRVFFLAAVFFLLAVSFVSTNGWWYISIYGIPWGGTPPSIAGVKLSSVFVALTLLTLLAGMLLHFAEPFLPNRGRTQWQPKGKVLGTVREIAHSPLGVAAALVVVIMVASMAAAVRNQYPAYSVGLQNWNSLQGRPCGIADAVLTEPDPNAGMLTPVGGSEAARDQLSAGGQAAHFGPNGIPADLTASQSADTTTVGTGENSNTTSTTAGTGGGIIAGAGINGSRAKLPFGLDPARVPVLGSHQVGQQLDAETTSAWYPLPERRAEQPLMVISAAGSFSAAAVKVEYTTGDPAEPGQAGSEVQPTGSVVPIDIGPAPSWRNLRVPMDSIPADATAVRLVVRDGDPDPDRWVAVTPPRIAHTTTLQQFIGDTRPVLADWAVAYHTPCLRPFNEYAGIAELPEYRVSADRGLTIAAGNTWQGWDGGGPLGFTELLLGGETVPTYLNHDWSRDWGSLIRYEPLVPTARPAEVSYGSEVRSGLWNGGPLAR